MTPVCQDGFGHPWHVPLTTLKTEGTPVAHRHRGTLVTPQTPTTLKTEGTPVAQALGPPLPAPVVRKRFVAAKLLAQNPVGPKVVEKPLKLACRALAHESFQGISGI